MSDKLDTKSGVKRIKFQWVKSEQGAREEIKILLDKIGDFKLKIERLEKDINYLKKKWNLI